MLTKEVEIRLPQTSEEVRESLIVFWHRSEGDWVKQGEVLVEVQTEKAVFEIEAPVTGRLINILVKRGEVAAVDDILAVIEPAAEEPAVSVREKTGDTEKAKKSEERDHHFVRASPRVRRLAKELKVDLTTLVGTGPEGRITEKDVRRAANSLPSSAEESITPLTPVRRTIARRMMESLGRSAQLTITAWADVTRLSVRGRELAPEIGFTAWILRATVLSVEKHPYMNAVWEENGIRTFSSVHLGIAVDTEEGLLVPVIPRAERMSLRQLDEAVRRIAEEARSQKLAAKDLKGSTFTVSNLGPYGVQFFTPILNPPEAALLGVGQIDSRLVLEGERPVEQKRLPLSLTFDHRIIDGAPAARFLQTLVGLLADPDRLL
ncbi:pyruvate dehydrogenase E2 component (dihydrolipoamide acetyltransferase) [Planifilum fimeticola]|uniref:Dihydrolipoamide acetyltransferase component of pyruvate dehydrogenase complex n=1 Tax=Planifilum fimeticola TaxID=201975 RepID=A0A2T0LJL1_9BACL|nr:pyruvate dehydrogenase E2 component (dihydrolipoamide acetyltransferase) [Planifilum fimeticola]